ncbi:MAG TPA: nucleotide disphospho-sugar-binding domain-containing protein, partial [Ktedonobacteraceae bacterium]|nr:nucleotide disphospho-sugar-binding domain-containing protein [Ktedonobacteraceae bacterium]
IVFLPKLFQPRAETFDHRYLFVGPCLAPRQEASSFPWNRLRSEQPLLYISLGTVANNQPEFFKLCFAALGASNYQVVLSGGGQFAPDAFAPVPANFLTALYVPQTEMLARAQVFVTHGGMNSVMESLSYGVPMVAIPQQMEQARTAQRLVELGLAIMLAKETVTATELREAIEQVASDATFRQRAQQMQQVMHDAGGAGQAAEAIIQFAEKQERGNNV